MKKNIWRIKFNMEEINLICNYTWGIYDYCSYDTRT